MRRAATTYLMMMLGLAWPLQGAHAQEGPVQVGQPGGPPLVHLGPSPDDCATPGCLDHEMIKRAIKAQSPRIRHCYERALQQDPTVQGKLNVRFTIAPDGTVPKAEVAQTTLKGQELQTCVLEAIQRLQFPKLPEGSREVVVTYPFNFTPAP